MSLFVRWYLRSLNTRPWTTQAITTGIIMASGDVICQTCVERKNLRELHPVRIARFAFLGTFIVGPGLRTWYILLEKWFGVQGASVGLKKMLLDQGAFAPFFLANFLVIMGIIQRETTQEIKQRIEQDYISILKANYTVWPAIQLITFYVIPFQHRLIFVNTVAVLWNTYLSWKANRGSLHKQTH